jgi:hypothetical protein
MNPATIPEEESSTISVNRIDAGNGSGMMLRRRIEKLEMNHPSTATLVDRWESQAMASLSNQDRALVAESFSASRRKPQNSPAHVAAMKCYEDALAATIAEVSDEELDRMILSLDPTQRMATGASLE